MYLNNIKLYGTIKIYLEHLTFGNDIHSLMLYTITIKNKNNCVASTTNLIIYIPTCLPRKTKESYNVYEYIKKILGIENPLYLFSQLSGQVHVLSSCTMITSQSSQGTTYLHV